MFVQSKLAENEPWSAFHPLTKLVFLLRSHRRGWSWSIFVRPGLSSVWEHPAVFEARSSHSHWPWTVCSLPATIVQTEKTEMVSRLSLELGLGSGKGVSWDSGLGNGLCLCQSPQKCKRVWVCVCVQTPSSTSSVTAKNSNFPPEND